MGTVQWHYRFPIPWSQKRHLDITALSLSFIIPPLGIYIGSEQKSQPAKSQLHALPWGLFSAGTLKHPEMWAQVHKKNWSQASWFLWANVLAHFQYMWDFINVFKGQLSGKHYELRGYCNSAVAVVSVTRAPPQLAGHGPKSATNTATVPWTATVRCEHKPGAQKALFHTGKHAGL